MTIAPEPIGGGAVKIPRIEGKLHMTRTATSLHPTFANTWPTTAAELLHAVAAERQGEWIRRLDQAKDPLARGLAAAVLQSFLSPPAVEAADLDWPVADEPKNPNSF